MARIKTLLPPCGYKLEGLDEIKLLDFEDFGGYRFDGDDLYSNCLVNAILRNAEFIELPAPDGAKYSSTLSNKIYTHVLETFLSGLSADFLSNLHLGTKRRFIPVFKMRTGRYGTFGYEAGATLTYTTQTADSNGSLISIVATSIYPLFEATTDALTNKIGIEYLPNFDMGGYCETI